MDYALKESSTKFENILGTALKVPGVRVDREQFLLQTLGSKIKDGNIVNLAIETDPVTAGIPIDKLDKIANSLIKKRTTNTSMVSFVAGVRMEAKIPADTLQFFGTAIKLAQELVYLYGYGEIGNANQLDEDIKRELTLYLGVMFGIEKSAATLRVFTTNMSKQVLTRTSRRALSKTALYSITKKMGEIIGVKVTKAGFAKGVSKAVPIVGGVISGGTSYVSMNHMGHRLSEVLRESIFYTEADYEKDYKNICNEVVDVEFN